MIDHGKLTMRGRYGIATGGAVTDHVLLAVAAEFDTAVMRKIAALSPAEIPQRFAGDAPLLVAPKYDGEGVFAYYEQGRPPFLFSPAGRVRLGLPALDALQARLDAAGVRRVLLRCELCLPHAGGQRRDGVADVIRISFSGSDDDLARLKLVLLDAVMLDGRDLRPQQSEFDRNLELLRQLGGTDASARVHAMEAEIMPEQQVAARFAAVVESGGEGLVVRRLNRAEGWKLKPHRTVDAVVIGFVEGEFEGQYGVTSLLTALTYAGDDGTSMQTFVRAGSGLTDAERVAMLDRLRPLKVDAPLAMTDSSGRAVQFVRPQLVAVIHGEDLVVAEGGREQRTQLLEWNEAAQQWRFLGLAACPRLTFARYRSLREDKDWRGGGARIEQIVERAERPVPQQSGNDATEVIRRELYAKGEMLRKLVVVRKGGDAAFPYLVYWTDYSAKRAEPLKVSTEVAATAERAHALAERLLAENLTKGFAKVGG